ncbi:MAG: hypothetical protein NTY38_31310 [Acidobacteria bacterium]|nr:hypothetical protein [Acidobacteriota bacterium]
MQTMQSLHSLNGLMVTMPLGSAIRNEPAEVRQRSMEGTRNIQAVISEENEYVKAIFD